MATLPVHALDLHEEIEGNMIEVNDLFFHKIGEDVPVASSDFQFDDGFLPLQLLEVSERFQTIFVANYRGFLAARTRDVIELANQLKNKGNALSLEEICVISVTIGEVNILALSACSSFIAVVVGADVHFYEVKSLLNKDKKASFLYSFGKSSGVKDILWNNKQEKLYLVLSENGMLYHGTVTDPPQLVLKDVDAVAWDKGGDFIAVAKSNVVSILSSKFIEKLSMSLAVESWTSKSEGSCMKVDSIRWVRPDCIILGCFEMSGSGKEDNYVVQVITCKHGEIVDVSSEPFVLSFADLFPAFFADTVPSDNGPCLFFSYLEQRELAIFANRRNTDQHILMMGWSQCDTSIEAVVLDIGRDNLRPWVNLNENGDDNMVLGLCIDRTPISEKVKVHIGVDEQKLLTPFCILICVTLDANIVMFYVSSYSTKDAPVFSGPSDAASLEEVSGVASELTCQKGGVSEVFNQKLEEKPLESNKSHASDSVSDILAVAVTSTSHTKLNSDESHDHIEAGNPLPKYTSSNEVMNNARLSDLSRETMRGSEQKFSDKFGNMNEMTRELDRLLNCIEGPGGFKDACTKKDSLITLEQDVDTLFDQCKYWKNTMDDQQCTIQRLLEQTAQVMARKTYIEGIVKQVKDTQYWDLWGTQKLSSELHKKKQHILEIKQIVSSQLTELEKHFNALELDKFGVPVRSIKESRGAFHPTRNMQSYYSLHKVMRSQLEAAEHHSDCLSRQMTMLGIQTSEKKMKENKDLFKSIGISCEGDSFSTPISKKKVEDCLLQSNSRLDSDSARRRRDSLDQSWASFDPPTTMLRRAVAASKDEKPDPIEEQQPPLATASSDFRAPATPPPAAMPPPPLAQPKRHAENKHIPAPPLSGPSPLQSAETGSNKCVHLPRPDPSFLRPEPPPPSLESHSVSAPVVSAVPPNPGPTRDDPELSKKTGFNLDQPEDQRPLVEAPAVTVRQPEKTENSEDEALSSEDEMEEETPDMGRVMLSGLTSLSGFGLGSSPTTTVTSQNPFGGSFTGTGAPPPAFPGPMGVPSGELFRPASFTVAEPQKVFGSGASVGPAGGGGGFGRQAAVGVGQQALGSVLGAFGKSRELGGGVVGGFPMAAQPGFTGAVGSGGGFAGAGSVGGGGFTGVAASGGGFGAFGSGSAGGGFSGVTAGGRGFGAFGNQASGGGFSSFGSGPARPASDLFTQMRK